MGVIIGIDPGCSGALVAVDEKGEYVAHLNMPTIKVGSKARVNGAQLSAWLQSWSISHAYLEQVGAMPGQGTASMFTFGHAAGIAEGILQGAHIPYTLVTPQAWKKPPDSSAATKTRRGAVQFSCTRHSARWMQKQKGRP